MSFRPDLPIAGFYRVKLVRKGPWIAARIWRGFPRDPETGETLERGWIWRGEIDGREVDVWRLWPSCAADGIDEREWRYLEALRAYALMSDPTMPEANPREPVDFNTLRFEFKRKE